MDMSIDTERIETVTFDSFTTIVDVMTTTYRELSRNVEDEETVDEITSLWRFRAVEYRMLCNYMDTYETYYETTRDALEYALAVTGVELDDEAVEDVVSQFYDLDVFDDVYESFRRLDEQGYDMYIVSNGTQDLLESMVSGANICEFVEDTISADDVKTYKPDVEFYQHAATQTETPADQIVHVATPWYDIYGANNAGMQTVWVNRDGKPWEKFDGSPDEIVPNLAKLPPVLE